jgi:predicted amidohydrolase/GNAT superfamily N-acetyltransferase
MVENENTIEIRMLQMGDYMDLKKSMVEAYPPWEEIYWKRHHIKRLLDLFPEGQICILVNDKVVGAALSLIVDYERLTDDHTYDQVIANYSFTTHDPKGDVLYGIDIFVHPDYRNMRLGRRMYDARKDLCEKLNLRGIIAGGRLPKYKDHASEMTPKEYIYKVKHKEIYDPTLSFQLANDFHVRKILKNYLPEDQDSLEYAALIEWNNIYYQEKKSYLKEIKPVVRIGIVQWQMRPMANLEAVSDQIEFFVDAVSGYQSDFILFPEFFNAPLMADYNHLPEPEAIRELAKYTEPIRKRISELAIEYNVNIISGSMPFIEDDKLKNVGYLCRRDGSYDWYEKIHITPSEISAWGMTGGAKIQCIDTDCGKIGVQICYDVEFPELSRIMADQGMNILFVPFLTDTQNGYMRVRNCCMSRAIENECYVAMAGCVGNLPKVANMDIQYAQSGVFTPSDFAFPVNSIKAETTPNTEMTLVVDVDLDLLKQLHNYGSVRNLLDRRQDLYTLVHKKK